MNIFLFFFLEACVVTLGSVTLGSVTLCVVTFGSVTLGSVTLCVVTLWAVTLGSVTLCAVTLGSITLCVVTLCVVTLCISGGGSERGGSERGGGGGGDGDRGGGGDPTACGFGDRGMRSYMRRTAARPPGGVLVFRPPACRYVVHSRASAAALLRAAGVGEIGLMGVKAFMFHEGQDPIAGKAFREIARLTGGAYMPFNTAAADELRAMLGAVATYAAGGRPALESSPNKAAKLLASRIGR